MSELPCGCTKESIVWETNFEEFGSDGEARVQSGECDCGCTYNRRWTNSMLTREDGRIVEDYTQRPGF